MQSKLMRCFLVVLTVAACRDAASGLYDRIDERIAALDYAAADSLLEQAERAGGTAAPRFWVLYGKNRLAGHGEWSSAMEAFDQAMSLDAAISEEVEAAWAEAISHRMLAYDFERLLAVTEQARRFGENMRPLFTNALMKAGDRWSADVPELAEFLYALALDAVERVYEDPEARHQKACQHIAKRAIETDSWRLGQLALFNLVQQDPDHAVTRSVEEDMWNHFMMSATDASLWRRPVFADPRGSEIRICVGACSPEGFRWSTFYVFPVDSIPLRITSNLSELAVSGGELTAESCSEGFRIQHRESGDVVPVCAIENARNPSLILYPVPRALLTIRVSDRDTWGSPNLEVRGYLRIVQVTEN